MKLSITRALAELKLLNKKIHDKIAKLRVSAVVNSSSLLEHTILRDEFIEKETSGLQQVTDLIDRRNRIKAAIVQSNAMTNVVINNKTMTVAEAIERKTAIELEKELLKKMRANYFGAIQTIENENAQQREKANQQALTAVGGKENTEGYKEIADAYYDRNKVELVSVPGMEDKIDLLTDHLEGFESEVDFALSESNTVTQIEIAD